MVYKKSMANHKSAVKSHKQSLKHKARNIGITSRIKTFIKKVESFISAGNVEEAQSSMRLAESEIMTGVTRGVFKRNTASRKVSRMVKKIKALSPA
jgi:small subunit ribosomal protein S20